MISMPPLIAQGLADTTVFPTVQEKYVQERCAAGKSLDIGGSPGRTTVPSFSQALRMRRRW
jgi:hypothetical protein